MVWFKEIKLLYVFFFNEKYGIFVSKKIRTKHHETLVIQSMVGIPPSMIQRNQYLWHMHAAKARAGKLACLLTCETSKERNSCSFEWVPATRLGIVILAFAGSRRAWETLIESVSKITSVTPAIMYESPAFMKGCAKVMPKKDVLLYLWDTLKEEKKKRKNKYKVRPVGHLKKGRRVKSQSVRVQSCGTAWMRVSKRKDKLYLILWNYLKFFYNFFLHKKRIFT